MKLQSELQEERLRRTESQLEKKKQHNRSCDKAIIYIYDGIAEIIFKVSNRFSMIQFDQVAVDSLTTSCKGQQQCRDGQASC